MYVLIQFFVDLARLRRAPQDLPASASLLGLSALLSVTLGALNVVPVFGDLHAALGANLLDLVLSLAMIVLLLQLRGHPARWQQTATAFFGLGALAGAIVMMVRVPAEALGARELAAFVELVVAVWLHVAFGHVLRHALGVPLLAGVMIVLSYSVLSFNVIARVFPVNIGG